MLNNVPIGGVSLWSEWSVLKIAATIGVAGVIGTGLYFYLKDSNSVIQHVPKAEVRMDSLLPDDSTTETVIEEIKEESEPEKKETVTPQIRKTKPKKEKSTSPKVSVVDPSAEMLTDGNDVESGLITEKSVISVSTIKVERDSQNKLYTFHYQFLEGKLFLYGPFDETLYEILEVHGNNHALFLFFKGNFYHLDESKAEATALNPIRERSLIQKLKEFRGTK
jgi:hypothetical protein